MITVLQLLIFFSQICNRSQTFLYLGHKSQHQSCMVFCSIVCSTILLSLFNVSDVYCCMIY
ncbi:uncharacterized protein DS421_9g257150 [Arachis hypogaea]|nr:uncharacterized protein DS421_9g257150 [Arachis hypogaea]